MLIACYRITSRWLFALTHDNTQAQGVELMSTPDVTGQSQPVSACSTASMLSFAATGRNIFTLSLL